MSTLIRRSDQAIALRRLVKALTPMLISMDREAVADHARHHPGTRSPRTLRSFRPRHGGKG